MRRLFWLVLLCSCAPKAPALTPVPVWKAASVLVAEFNALMTANPAYSEIRVEFAPGALRFWVTHIDGERESGEFGAATLALGAFQRCGRDPEVPKWRVVCAPPAGPTVVVAMPDRDVDLAIALLEELRQLALQPPRSR